MIVCYSPISIIRSLNHSTSGSARSVLLLVPSVCFFKRDYAKYPDAHIYKPHFNEHTKIRGRTNPFLLYVWLYRVLLTQEVLKTYELFTNEFKNHFCLHRPAHFYGVARELAVL